MTDAQRAEIAKLETLHAEHPQGRIFTHLAEAYRKAGELDRARTVLAEGIERHPDYSSAHVVLARVLMDQGEAAESEAEFRRVLELDPHNLVALRSLGDLARAAGRTEEAVSCYERLLEVEPSDEDVQDILDSLTGETAEAAETLDTDAGGLNTETIAQVYARQGLYDRAADVYRQLLASRPDDGELRSRLEEMEALAEAPTPGAEPEAPQQDEVPWGQTLDSFGATGTGQQGRDDDSGWVSAAEDAPALADDEVPEEQDTAALEEARASDVEPQDVAPEDVAPEDVAPVPGLEIPDYSAGAEVPPLAGLETDTSDFRLGFDDSPAAETGDDDPVEPMAGLETTPEGPSEPGDHETEPGLDNSGALETEDGSLHDEPEPWAVAPVSGDTPSEEVPAWAEEASNEPAEAPEPWASTEPSESTESEAVESVWTGAAGAQEDATTPYAWADEEPETDGSDPVGEYLRGLLTWKAGVGDEGGPAEDAETGGEAASDAEGMGELEADDDLDVFRSWLESLKE